MSHLLRLSAYVVFVLAATATLTNAAERPNIVMIMADDLGYSDLGCFGGEIETPNLDQLAADGLRMTQFYNTAKCHSSRICLLTGRYVYHDGSRDLARHVTFAEVLREAGYSTLMSGKWHLSSEPTNRGFDRYFGHLSGATNFFTGDQSFRLDGKPFDDFGPDFYTTDAITDYAIEFVSEANESKPFLLYVAYNAPHYPLQAPRADVERYRGKYMAGWDVLRPKRFARQQALGIVTEKHVLPPRPSDARPWDSLTDDERDWEDFRMATYAAMVDRMDRNIGRLIDHLRQTGQLENTLLVFCSDNGACPFERTKRKQYDPWDSRSYWTYDEGWAHMGNTPYRWYKQNQHEGGVRSPMVVHWPAGLEVAAGSLSRQPAHLIDLMATFTDVAEADYPDRHEGREILPLQGKSLVPVLNGGRRSPHDRLFFQYGNNHAVRQGDWKLVSVRGGPWELYNLASDPTEMHDLVSEKPELVAEMKAAWQQFDATKDVPPGTPKRP